MSRPAQIAHFVRRSIAPWVMAALVVGCSRASPDPALAVADRYYAALGASDFAGACALMTESQREGFEGGTCEAVMRFLLETDGPPGPRELEPRGTRIAAAGDRQTFELRYQVAYGSGTRIDILKIVGTAGQPATFRIDGIARQEVLIRE